MQDKNICILLYSNDQDVRLAIEQLQTHQFNLQMLSIVGNGNTPVDQSEETQPLGVSVLHESLNIQSQKGGFWEILWSKFNDRLFFLLPKFGVLVAMGPIVKMMLETNINIRSNFSVFGAALHNMGIPRDNIVQYENELKSGMFFLMVNGMRCDVEHCSEILHNEKHQATVHLA